MDIDILLTFVLQMKSTDVSMLWETSNEKVIAFFFDEVYSLYFFFLFVEDLDRWYIEGNRIGIHEGGFWNEWSGVAGSSKNSIIFSMTDVTDIGWKLWELACVSLFLGE